MVRMQNTQRTCSTLADTLLWKLGGSDVWLCFRVDAGDLLLAMEGCRHDSHVFVVIAHGPLVKSDSMFQHLACVAT